MICTCGARSGDNPNCALHGDTVTTRRDDGADEPRCHVAHHAGLGLTRDGEWEDCAWAAAANTGDYSPEPAAPPPAPTESAPAWVPPPTETIPFGDSALTSADWRDAQRRMLADVLPNAPAPTEALVSRLRGVDPEGRSYAHVMTPLTHSLIREAAAALERLAADLAAWKRRWQECDREWAKDQRRLRPSLARLKSERDAAEARADLAESRLDGQEWEDLTRENERLRADWAHSFGAPPFDGNGPCMDCRGPNPTWFAENPLWNRIISEADRGLILCMHCFIQRAFDGGITTVWRLDDSAVNDQDAANGDLRARLGKVKAQRDALRAQVAAVRALHIGAMPYGGQAHCKAGCGDWPCPTIAALDTAPEGRERPATLLPGGDT